MIVKDMQEMIDLLRARGHAGDSYELNAPLNYARALHAELTLRGIDLPVPFSGDELYVELENRAKVTVVVH